MTKAVDRVAGHRHAVRHFGDERCLIGRRRQRLTDSPVVQRRNPGVESEVSEPKKRRQHDAGSRYPADARRERFSGAKIEVDCMRAQEREDRIVARNDLVVDAPQLRWPAPVRVVRDEADPRATLIS